MKTLSAKKENVELLITDISIVSNIYTAFVGTLPALRDIKELKYYQRSFFKSLVLSRPIVSI